MSNPPPLSLFSIKKRKKNPYTSTSMSKIHLHCESPKIVKTKIQSSNQILVVFSKEKKKSDTSSTNDIATFVDQDFHNKKISVFLT